MGRPHAAGRVDEATGIKFAYIDGQGKEQVFRCGRCHALVMWNNNEINRHAQDHARVDSMGKALVALAGTVAQITPGAFKAAEPGGHRQPDELRRGAERVRAWLELAGLDNSNDSNDGNEEQD